MANEQNLLKGDDRHKLSVEEASRGGKASVEARRRKRDLRNALELLLERDFKDKAGNDVSGAGAIAAKLFEQAMKGNIRAFEVIRSTVGQDPVQKVEQVNIDMEYQESVEYVKRMMQDE